MPEQLPRNLPCWHPLALCLCPMVHVLWKDGLEGTFLVRRIFGIRSCLRVKYIAMHARIGSPSMRYVLYKILAGQLLGRSWLIAHPVPGQNMLRCSKERHTCNIISSNEPTVTSLPSAAYSVCLLAKPLRCKLPISNVCEPYMLSVIYPLSNILAQWAIVRYV